MADNPNNQMNEQPPPSPQFQPVVLNGTMYFAPPTAQPGGSGSSAPAPLVQVPIIPVQQRQGNRPIPSTNIRPAIYVQSIPQQFNQHRQQVPQAAFQNVQTFSRPTVSRPMVAPIQQVSMQQQNMVPRLTTRVSQRPTQLVQIPNRQFNGTGQNFHLQFQRNIMYVTPQQGRTSVDPNSMGYHDVNWRPSFNRMNMTIGSFARQQMSQEGLNERLNSTVAGHIQTQDRHYEHANSSMQNQRVENQTSEVQNGNDQRSEIVGETSAQSSVLEEDPQKQCYSDGIQEISEKLQSTGIPETIKSALTKTIKTETMKEYMCSKCSHTTTSTIGTQTDQTAEKDSSDIGVQTDSEHSQQTDTKRDSEKVTNFELGLSKISMSDFIPKPPSFLTEKTLKTSKTLAQESHQEQIPTVDNCHLQNQLGLSKISMSSFIPTPSQTSTPTEKTLKTSNTLDQECHQDQIPTVDDRHSQNQLGLSKISMSNFIPTASPSSTPTEKTLSKRTRKLESERQKNKSIMKSNDDTLEELEGLRQFKNRLENALPEYIKRVSPKRHAFLAFQSSRFEFVGLESEIVEFLKKKCLIEINCRRIAEDDKFPSLQSSLKKYAALFGRSEKVDLQKLGHCCLILSENTDLLLTEDVYWIFCSVGTPKAISLKSLQLTLEKYSKHVIEIGELGTVEDEQFTPCLLSDFDGVEVSIAETQLLYFIEYINRQYRQRFCSDSAGEDTIPILEKIFLDCWQEHFPTGNYIWTQDLTLEFLTYQIQTYESKGASMQEMPFKKFFMFLRSVKSSILDFDIYWADKSIKDFSGDEAFMIHDQSKLFLVLFGYVAT